MLDLPDMKFAYNFETGVGLSGGDVYYRALVDAVTIQYDVLRRLSDDRVLAVVRMPRTCASSPYKIGAPLLLEYYPDGLLAWSGRFDPAAGEIREPSKLFNFTAATINWFSLPNGWGMLQGGSSMQVVLDSAPEVLQTVVQSDGSYLHQARKVGSEVFFTDWTSGASKVRVWSEAAGEKTLFTAPHHVQGLGVSPTAIAFVDAQGVDIAQFTSPRVMWSPYTTDPGAVMLISGPDVSGYISGGGAMGTGGDFIAMRATPPASMPDQWGLIVVQMSTGKAYRILPAPGKFLEFEAVTPTELIAAEGDQKDPPQSTSPLRLRRWKRFDLTHLADFAAELPP